MGQRSESSAESRRDATRRQRRSILLGSFAILCGFVLLARLQILAVRRQYAPVPQPGILININTADEAALSLLDRIGPERARRIVAWRSEHGPFRSYPDLERVDGIGPETVAALLGRIRFDE